MPEDSDPTPPPMDERPDDAPTETPPPMDEPTGELPPPTDENGPAPLDFPSLGLGTMSEKDEKLWAMLCHLLVFAPLALAMIPGVQFSAIFCFLGPLVVWLLKRQESPFVDEHGKESINQQIVIAVIMVIGNVLLLVCVGIFVILGAGLYNLVVVILASIKANEGKGYRYPLSYRIIK